MQALELNLVEEKRKSEQDQQHKNPDLGPAKGAEKPFSLKPLQVLSEVTASLYCNCVHLYFVSQYPLVII